MGNVTWGVQKTWTHAALLALSRHYLGAIAVDFTHSGECVLVAISTRRSIGSGETLERACELAIQRLTDAEILAASFPDHDGDTQPNNERPEPECSEPAAICDCNWHENLRAAVASGGGVTS